MTEILEYIMSNYTWFLGGAILILLAIIGSYADKTNFGQGKKEVNDKKNEDIDLGVEQIESVLDQEQINQVDTDELQIENNQEVTDDKLEESIETQENSNIDNTISEPVIETSQPTALEEEKNLISDETKSQTENDFNKFDEEFDTIIPKKEIIDEELLNDIDNLSLDKTQRFDFKDIPDLDDVELPKIKSLSTDDQDIWKF